MRYLDRVHPICAFVYFVSVLVVAMVTMHPVVVGLCFLTGVSLYGTLCGGRRLLKSLGWSLPMMVLVALLNPILSHKGSTVVLFLNDTPITLESIVFGVTFALMIAAVFYWFACYSEIMTSDKFIYLFGRMIPKLSLLLSMTLAAIPRLKRQYREIDDAQRALAPETDDGAVAKLRRGGSVFSALVSRALEGSIETADSMRARGYGLRGRTAYTIFRFTASDAVVLVLTLLLVSAVLVLTLVGDVNYAYYPTLGTVGHGAADLALYAALTLLCGGSILMEVKETILWHTLRSSI